MNNDRSAPLGMIFLSDTVLHVDNAIIEEVAANTERTGFLLISFRASEEQGVIYTEEIRLNIGNDTIIIDEDGTPLSMFDLSEGMQISADFSSAMTRSIPPQSFAFRIVVLQEELSVSITTDRVVDVDISNGFLITGNPYSIYDQMIFTISDATEILNQDNEVISLEEIQPGQLVRVEHAIFQTLSIPPQSPAYRVYVL